MHSLSLKVLTSTVVSIIVALVFFALCLSVVSADTGFGVNGGGGHAKRNRNTTQEDSRAYSVAAIRACISANVPSDTGSSTPATISKEKGNTLVSCIKNARERKANSDAVSDLLKKIEELRAQIQALRNN
jgi:hypothetical protein